MLVWFLTIVLGTGLEFTDPNPFPSYEDCKKEGKRLVMWYRQDFIPATWECDSYDASRLPNAS